MNSTPDPKENEPHDALIAAADEWLAHAHEQIKRADEQLTRLTEQLAKMERDDARPPSRWPQRSRRQRKHHHHRKQQPWLRTPRRTPRRRQPQRLPIRRSCCKQWRATSRAWSEASNSSRRTSSKWPATIQKPSKNSRRARRR